MDDNNRNPSASPTIFSEYPALFAAGLPLVALMIVSAALYFAREVLIPLSAALVLGVVLSPIASRLERWVGRFFAAALLVVAGVAIIAGLTYFAVEQLTTIANEVAGYSDNIARKINSIEKSTPPWLQHVESAVKNVKQQVQKNNKGQQKEVKTVAVTSTPLTARLHHYAPALTGVVEAVLVVVLLFFLLYDRRDLRDRFVRLAARARIVISANTIESAGHTVGLYLLLISLNNFCFGVILALVLWMLGLPNPEFWGLLAFLLRYIPYIGATISSLLPAIVAFAVFPGWMKSFEVIGFYAILDQITVHLIEPFMIGSGIDMSPVALLVSVMYWSWLWGVAGLLLAIPLTACIKVAAEHIEQLNFISLVLGGERALERYHEFYRLLLEMDSAGAQGMVIRYCNEKGIEAAFDQIITPAVRLAGRERSRDHISPEQFQYMIGFVRDLIPDLGSRFGRGRAQTNIRVLGICPPGEVHTLGLLTVLQLFRCAGAAVRFAGEGISIQDISELVRSFMPAAVCISVSTNEAMPTAIELTAMLRHAYPGLLILAGGDAVSSRAEELMRAGCTRICAGRSDLNRTIRVIAGGRKLRTHSISATSHAERT